MTMPDTIHALHFLPPATQAALRLTHIGGGLAAIAAGFTAVIAPKGRPLHRASGTVFFLAMLAMAGLASVLAVNKGQTMNTVAGAFTLYLVLTAWVTVRRQPDRVGRLEVAGMLMALTVSGFAIYQAYQGSLNPNGIDGAPYQVAYVFGALAAIAAAFDLVTLARRGLHGSDRISRHLWRMCLALFVASGSFFLGQMKVIPHALRGPHLWVLAFLPLVALVFWLIRVRFRSALDPAPAAA
jgi:uncharacterized membrane protein